MSAPRQRVAILFGGESPEHQVSLQSAKNVVEAIDRDRWDVILVAIDRVGVWRVVDAEGFLTDADDPGRIELTPGGRDVALVPGRGFVPLDGGEALPPIDVAFPVLHGPNGEDGTIQGLFRLAHVPYVGPDVLGSAVAMDKDIAKRLLVAAGVDVAPFILVRDRAGAPGWSEASAKLGTPVFVKPANMGSSVGVSRVDDEAAYSRALDEAFQYDKKILLEQAIDGREIECSVLGNEHPEASLPGEVAPRSDFYSYEAKYLDGEAADLFVPADLDEETTARLRATAVDAFRALGCEGMARVDFFVTPDGRLIVNEINTLPGFTKISMYPKLWIATGLSYADLIDRLLELAIERAERRARLASALKSLVGS